MSSVVEYVFDIANAPATYSHVSETNTKLWFYPP